MRPFARTVSAHLGLCKVEISLFATLSAATGFLLSAFQMKPQMVILMIGVCFLACGSSALNQYLERERDRIMPRTKNRPIPSGRISPRHALYLALILISLGLVTLLLTGKPSALLLGIFAVFWYNGVYTHLKKKTAFASVPGALVGAIPPAIGWITGGGSLEDTKLLALCFFFMWQIPHFWLLVLRYGEEYKEAGFPSLSDIFTSPQLSRIIFNWIVATAVSCLRLSGFSASGTTLINVLLAAVSLWLVWNGMKLLREGGGRKLYVFTFRRINVYMFLVMILLSINKLLIQPPIFRA